MPDNMAIDREGRPLPCSPDQVKAIVQRAMRDGELLAAVFRMPSGDVAVQVLGEPSLELLEALEQTAFAYRRALEGQ